MKGMSFSGIYWIPANQFKAGNFDMITVLNGKKHEKQEQALKILTDKTTRRFCYGGAAGGAKSWTGCCWLLFSCLIYPETRWFVGRETLMDIEQSTLPTFEKVCKAYGVHKDVDYKYNANKHTITFTNGSVIVLLNLEYAPSDPNYDSLGSTEYTGGWIEEGAGVDAKAYETLGTRIGRCNNDKYGILDKILVTTNPTKNWIYNLFYLPYKEKRLRDDYVFLQAWHYDNPHIEKGYAKNLEDTTDEVQRARLLDGDFDYNETKTALCDAESIDNVFRNMHVMETANGTKKLSADLAMQGRDRFVVVLWRGNVAQIVLDQKKATGRSIETELRGQIAQYGIQRKNVVVDSDGLGNYLESYLEGVVAFKGNETATKPKDYANLKTECAYKLAEKINKKEILVICQNQEQETALKQELAMLRVKKLDADERSKQIIPKDDMKKQIGRSPDYMDALIMGQVFDIKKSNIWITAY